ncbi:MAG TPA: hypothetical protein VNU97_15005 [Rhizomicrobium sp.]|nr:hypothetical protein [Rhizomicrobium sp.]
MKTIFGVVAGLLLFAGQAQARDAFDAIHCGADIPRLLTGKVMSDGTVVEAEARYKALSLLDEGGEIVNDRLNETGWRICGRSYEMLTDDKSVIRDVILFPVHSRAMPAFGGICKIAGKDMADAVDAVLDNRKGFDSNPAHHYAMDDRTLLPALAAWRVDEKHMKFVAVPVTGMMCPRSGLFTADGGA